MNEGKYILFFFGALGAFNGLLLGAYFLLYHRKKNLSGFFLGCLLVALSVRIGKSVFAYFDPGIPKLYLQIGLSACLLIGPALYFFIKATQEQLRTLPRAWKLQIIGLLSVILVGGALVPYATYPAIWNAYVTRGIYLVWLFYLALSGTALRGTFLSFLKQQAAVKPAEKWLLAIFAANAVICISFSFALFFGQYYNTYFAGGLVFSFALYTMILIHLVNGKADGLFNAKPDKAPVRKTVTAADATLQRLDELMAGQALYRNANLTLGDLARAVGLSPHQLSQLLNDSAGKNFTSYVNAFRIREACRMIEANHPFSAEAIGYEVGFNSKSTFYTAFKKITGTTPLLFREELARQSIN